jgi:hypothetical protein
MLTYEDGITYDLIDRFAKRQSKMHQDVLEDIGGYLDQRFRNASFVTPTRNASNAAIL